MNFGDAVAAMQRGERVARSGWNGKGMFAYYVPAASYPVQTGAAKSHFGEGSLVPYNAYLAIKNVNETVSTWVPSVNDVLASDWCIVGSPYEPHQQRVIAEKAELDGRLKKLRAFLGNTHPEISYGEELLLIEQARAMEEYSRVLEARILSFKRANQP